MENNRKSGVNVKVLVLTVVVFCVIAMFAFYAFKQDYGLRVEIEADTAKIGSDYCVIAYLYAENNKMVFVEIVENKAAFKIPASTRAFKMVSILYGSRADKILIDNNFIDHAFIGRITVNGAAVANDDLLGTLARTSAGLRARFMVMAAALGLVAAGLTWAGFYFYRKKARLNEMLTRALRQRQQQLHYLIALTQNKKFRVIFLLVFAVVVLVWRRPGQIWYPYIFAEDATIILEQYMAYGWKSLFYPVNGYYITISRIINILAFKISFWYYAELAALLANLFTIGVVFAIAYSPTRLKWPYLCALMTLLLKTGSECFGVALYSFWWAGLLLVLAVLWQNGKRPVLRNFFILLGGFSSPIVFVAAPLFIFLAVYKRKINDIVAAAVVLIPCILQMLVMHEGHNAKTISLQIFANIIRNIMGAYTFLQTQSFWLLMLGGILLTVIMVGRLKFPRRSLKGFIDGNLDYLLLLAWLAGAVLASIYRADWLQADRRPLGFFEHRYFFYPFILLSWINIWVIAELPNLYPRIVLKIFMILILFNFVFGGAYKAMPSGQLDVSWREQIALCMTGNEPGIWVLISTQWYGATKMSGEGLTKLVRNSLFFNDVEANLRSLGY